MTRFPRPVTLALGALVTSLTLSACGAHPGAAAVVGDDAISESRVDAVALAICSAQASSSQAGAAPEIAGRTARRVALDVLVNAALSRQFGESAGVEPNESQVSAIVDENQAAIDTLPAARRTVLTETLREDAAGRLAVAAAGQAELAKAGTRNVTPDQALEAGAKLRAAWVKDHVKVTVDPRYGRFSAGSLAFGSGSLSAPVSSRAAAGEKQEPAADWVSALPASQKCS